ncbi:hypothetical protein CP49_10235 [Bradyrhizobium valentinum]|uniref:Uncharacterized protein n=1 Tax=Bradyrhizobium valentinum TaxID=1518501 RepID=A0A0R3LEM2_9BRAD|nr:hypothetical protein CP49_10235 [Bradyrhizobium valentinum]
MILRLIRAIRFARYLVGVGSGKLSDFPDGSASGQLVEGKQDRATLSKWSNDLRQSFRTITTVAGVSEFDAKLQINQAVPGLNAGHITRHKLLENHLRCQQQSISSALYLLVWEHR